MLFEIFLGVVINTDWIRSSNPFLVEEAFHSDLIQVQTMEIRGIRNRCFLLVGLVLLGLFISFKISEESRLAWSFGSGVFAFGLAVFIYLVKDLAVFLASPFALFKGLALGSMVGVSNSFHQGIVLQAIIGSVLTIVAVLFVFELGLMKSSALRSYAAIVILALLIGHLFSGLFFRHRMPHIQNFGPLGIVSTVSIVLITALYLLVDFEFVLQTTQQGIPKRREWYAAVGLLITVVWLYFSLFALVKHLRKDH